MNKTLTTIGKTAGGTLAVTAAAGVLYFTPGNANITRIGDLIEGNSTYTEAPPWFELPDDDQKMRSKSESEARARVHSAISNNEWEAIGAVVKMAGYTQEEWKEVCDTCEWLKGEIPQLTLKVFNDFNLPNGMGLVEKESSFRQYNDEGNPLIVNGDIGLTQINEGTMGIRPNGKPKSPAGFDVVYGIINGTDDDCLEKRYQITRKKWKDPIEEYSHLLSGTKEEVLNRIKWNPEANLAAGALYFRYLLDQHGTKALEYYNAGENNHAPGYKEKVLASNREWEKLQSRCPSVEITKKRIYNKLLPQYKDSMLAANRAEYREKKRRKLPKWAQFHR